MKNMIDASENIDSQKSGIHVSTLLPANKGIIQNYLGAWQIWVSLILLFSGTFTVSKAKDSIEPSYYIDVTLSSIATENTSNTMIEVTLLYNGKSECIRVSEFDIEGIVRSAALFSDDGKVWTLLRRHQTFEPARDEIVYRLKLQQGVPKKLKLSLNQLVPLNVMMSGTNKFDGKYPKMLIYTLFGRADVKNCDFSGTQSLIVGGDGIVNLSSK